MILKLKDLIEIDKTKQMYFESRTIDDNLKELWDNQIISMSDKI